MLMQVRVQTCVEWSCVELRSIQSVTNGVRNLCKLCDKKLHKKQSMTDMQVSGA